MASRTPPGTMLAAFGLSHPGRQRDTNEDRFHVDVERGVFLVIDGVGGHAAGEHAAEAALTVLRARLERPTGTPADRIREAITLANNEIVRLGRARPGWAGMACVLTVVLVEDGVATVGHVGDTRLYRFSNGTAEKLTHDHSPVGEREDRGEISEIDAMRHPRRHEIYRDVGSEEHSPTDEGFVETCEVPFPADSALLLCTDGLTDLVPVARIRQIVHQHAGNRVAVVQHLIDAANEAGGKDNVTAVYVEGPVFPAAVRVATRRQPVGGISGPGRTRRVLAAVAGSRWVAFLAGLLAGMALSLGVLDWSRTVPAFWADAGRPLVSWSRTWVVGTSTGADVATIGDALRRALPGDTIVVEPGEYREAIHLAADVTLVSQRSREAVIRPPVGGPPGWVAVSVAAGAGGRFAGFRVAGDEQAPLAVGLRLEGAAIDVDDVEVSGADEAGIEIDGGDGGTVRASHIHENPGTGIVVRSGTFRLLHNVVTDNGRRPEGRKAGVEVGADARLTLFGNIVLHNGIDGIAGLDPSWRDQVARENILGALPAEAPPRAPVRPPR